MWWIETINLLSEVWILRPSSATEAWNLVQRLSGKGHFDTLGSFKGAVRVFKGFYDPSKDSIDHANPDF